MAAESAAEFGLVVEGHVFPFRMAESCFGVRSGGLFPIKEVRKAMGTKASPGSRGPADDDGGPRSEYDTSGTALSNS